MDRCEVVTSISIQANFQEIVQKLFLSFDLFLTLKVRVRYIAQQVPNSSKSKFD